jgi:hypothetical protein
VSQEGPAGKPGTPDTPLASKALERISDTTWMTHDQRLKLIEQMFGHHETRRITYGRTVVRPFAFALMAGSIMGIQAIADPRLAGSAWRWVMYAILVVLMSAAVSMELRDDPDLRARIRASIAGASVRGLTGLAAFLAGREGPALLDESDGHLAGESGHDPVSWTKVKEAAGFVVAGVRYRCSDWADAAWRPVDAVLRSRLLSGLFVAVPTIVAAVEVLSHKGTMTVLTSFGSIFGIGTALAGAIKAGRKYRDVEPPEPKARQARKGDRDT